MQLRVARLCLDCDEVHDAQACPVCGSESFAYITRWVPAPERRARPRPEPSSETVDAYRALLTPEPPQSGVGRWLRRGAVGIAALGVAGWMWRNAGQTQAADEPKDRTPPRRDIPDRREDVDQKSRKTPAERSS